MSEQETETEQQPDTETETEQQPDTETETETDGDGDGDTEQQDGETEQQQQQQSDVAMERAAKAVDRSAKTYSDSLIRNLGEDLGGWKPCPCCSTGWPGIVLPRVPDQAVVEAIKDYIGEPSHPDYDMDTGSTPCEKCHGYGVVSTGSKVQGRGTAQCLNCDGLGYVITDDRRKNGSVTALAVAPPVPAYGQPAPDAPEPPEVEALKALGYIVVAPVHADAV